MDIYLEKGVIGIFPICVKGIVPHLKRCLGVTSLSSENLEGSKKTHCLLNLPQLDVGHMKRWGTD